MIPVVALAGEAGYTYDYDGWNRLVAVRKQNGDLVVQHTYNGQGHRVSWKYDTDTDGDVDGSDQTFFFGYDETWRLVATARGTDTYLKELFVYHAAGDDGFGGSSYLDHVFRQYRNETNGLPGEPDASLETVHDYCHSWRPDVVALVTSSTGAVVEWVKYLSYGDMIGLAIGDTNSNGIGQLGDLTTIQTWAAAGPPATYDARGDINGDNQIDASDLSAWTTYAGGLSVLSHVGNRAGYAAYSHDPVLAGAFYHVRHRVLNSSIARWLQRDPLQYVDGMNQYLYVRNRPLALTDAAGLLARCVSVDSCAQPWPPPPSPGACDALYPLSRHDCEACCEEMVHDPNVIFPGEWLADCEARCADNGGMGPPTPNAPCQTMTNTLAGCKDCCGDRHDAEYDVCWDTYALPVYNACMQGLNSPVVCHALAKNDPAFRECADAAQTALQDCIFACNNAFVPPGPVLIPGGGWAVSWD